MDAKDAPRQVIDREASLRFIRSWMEQNPPIALLGEIDDLSDVELLDILYVLRLVEETGAVDGRTDR